VPGVRGEWSDAGGYDFVEPGDTHTETALDDTLLLVICEEDRPEFRRQPACITAGRRACELPA
jgi:hypothetical protein